MYKLCKTEQSARRQRQLEQGLLKAMEQHQYEDISISELCEHMGVPRKSFYRYFSSKDGALYALLDHTLLEYEFFRMPIYYESAENIQRVLESFFWFWKQQKPLLDALEISGISGMLIERTIASVAEATKNLQILERPKIRDHVIQFAVCGLMIMMINWHHGGYQESVSEMTEIAMRLVSQPLIAI